MQVLGVLGQILATMQALYTCAQYASHFNGRRGVSVKSTAASSRAAR